MSTKASPSRTSEPPAALASARASRNEKPAPKAPALSAPPAVVFVTGTDEPQIAVTALTSGATDFVTKTVGEEFFDLLAGRLRQALDRVALERAKSAAETELRQANDRLELLVREVHHRVSNSLQMVSSFVSLQASQTEDPGARDALAATQNRIQAISKVHNRLYTRGDPSTIDLDEYLATLVVGLRESLERSETLVDIALHADPIETTPDQAVSVGIIINELVGNAAKYAFIGRDSGTVAIELRAHEDGGFVLLVSDDGHGIDDSAGPTGTGLGMRIVAAMSRSLGCRIERLPCDRGTSYRCRVTGGGAG
ncbi:hypothetical protein J4558_09790 [Leptolyngbya sp. 15MV]|nr:hypothetical protein J4558_09790 [Leptolyngbya sp. 15MV]